MAVKNRKEIETLIYKAFDAIDPSKTNSEKYRSIFSPMNDKEFESFFKNFLANDTDQFILDTVEFEHTLSYDKCQACAKVLDIPLMETVYFPHLSGDRSNVVSTTQKCLVGYCPVKRTQQLLHKKNGLSVSNEKVSQLTGQVVNDDKNARDSDVEAAMLVSYGADAILAELHGPRADDVVMKRQLRQAIATKGFASLEELDNSSINKVTLNTINAFLLAMGLKSDLITDRYILPKTSSEHFR